MKHRLRVGRGQEVDWMIPSDEQATSGFLRMAQHIFLKKKGRPTFGRMTSDQFCCGVTKLDDSQELPGQLFQHISAMDNGQLMISYIPYQSLLNMMFSIAP